MVTFLVGFAMVFSYRVLIFLVVMIAVSGCASVDSRVKRAKSVAVESGMDKHIIDAGYFSLMSFSRLTDNRLPVKVYIEGDGFAWVSRNQVSGNPTPIDPLVLKLAAIEADIDKDSNIIYLARPCQYTDFDLSVSCSKKYWTGSRFSAEVVDSMSRALDDIKERNGFNKLDLIGYSGGAAIAVILAAKRDDINSLVTVAGNLNHEVVNDFHKVSPLDDSLNPYDYASSMSSVPQLHFIGADDGVIPYSITRDFVKSQKKHNDKSCSKAVLLKGVTHHEGWEENWEKLLRRKVYCE